MTGRPGFEAHHERFRASGVRMPRKSPDRIGGRMPALTLIVVAGSWLLLLVLTIWRVARWKDGGEE